MRYFLKFIKNTILFVFKQILGTIITLIFLAFLIGGVAVAYFDGKGETKIKLHTENAVNISFPNGIREENNIHWEYFNQNKNTLSFYQVIEALEQIRKDKKIKTIVLNLDNIHINTAQSEEMRKKILELKSSGKKIYAFANSLDKRNYSLGVVSDEIVMTPSHSTSVSFGGYRLKIPYYKKLADTFGVQFQVVHIGDYKSYGENYIKNKMSDEFKEDYTRLLDSNLNNFLNVVSENRKIGYDILEKKILEGDYLMIDSKEAKVEGLIDSLDYYDDFLKNRGIKNMVSLNEYASSHFKEVNNNKIGLIVADGNITMNSNSGVKSGYISPSSIIPQIDKAINDDSIKGVILRVNSPGGSALASEIILEKLIKLKNKKPLYISMGSVAASGGYYISSNGDKIFADEGTITGSIGVVSMIFNLEGLYSKLGLNWESIEKGKNLSVNTLTESSSEKELEIIRSSARKTYEEFKERVSNGRNISMDKVEELAQGKVYTANEAKRLGLIDQIGGIEEATLALSRQLELANYSLIDLGKTKNELDMIFELSSYMKDDTISKEFEKAKLELNYYKEMNNKFNYILPYDLNAD